jgi:hypothetical protein
MAPKDTRKTNWDYKPRTVKRPRRNPQRYLNQVSRGTRANVEDYHQEATLRGPLLGPDRRSKKNPYHTDLAEYHKKGGRRTRRRHRKSRSTRRR